MPQDPRVDAYIAGAAPFAQPILTHLRGLVHRACPDVEEAIKWSRPFFLREGRPFAAMSAFKAHATFRFWRANDGPERAEEFRSLTSLADLPDDAALEETIRAAADTPRPAPRPRSAPKPPLPMSADLIEMLAAGGAGAAFDALTPGQRREYIEWIEEAKRPETRAKRLATTLAQVAEGKSLNWQYR
ncbi:YdeI/OmpD-associated family protein [Sphingomonas nostoxanthinifaciens]|uniref:YdeI/OmpD-associated family protein n=1 Tax=Sphingomonas nostoxanthinifaciens TaxID=2872652 RepID=UPI001CC1EF9B|nr:YdeI/OmpD-associated family protein [Sphingomonas nostoxanthinifaciens]UAK26008.1 YdeI/OmpD-associated family protein [Sphingomonas nostoxanthinifaciens]